MQPAPFNQPSQDNAGWLPPNYEVSARIISQTQLDGSPLDTPADLNFGDGGTASTANPSTAERAAMAARAVTAAAARDSLLPTGAGGSGGLNPFSTAQLPGLPDLGKYLLIGLLAVGGIFVVTEGRRR
jgi:hypothetical protein